MNLLALFGLLFLLFQVSVENKIKEEKFNSECKRVETSDGFIWECSDDAINSLRKNCRL